MNEVPPIDAARYPRLARIDAPADLRRLEESELRAVADELRAYLIECVGHSGGHFGAGLGVIELTTALHYLYDTPGDRLVNLVNEFEYLKPIKIGDRLSSYMMIADVFVKPTRLDPLSTWIVTETHIENQDGETVAIGRNTLLTHRPPEEVAADPNGTGGSK